MIAVCARPFVLAAAQAGYRVAAFDIFNDVETRLFCLHSERVAFSDGGFDADDLWRKLCSIDPAQATVIYGSGLENQPELLDRISRKFSLLGNTAETVALVKDPSRFFPLLDELGISCPETRLDAPSGVAGWLVKSVGGSGGTHIRFFDDIPGGYYQRHVNGIPASVLFLANGANIEVVGYNEQWLAPASGMPFRYGGAVGNVDYPDDIKETMAEAASKIVMVTGLRGLNSMDFMLVSERVLVLEVNPRLTASFGLYCIPDLIERHLQACRGKLKPVAERPSGAKSHLIYYASHTVDVTDAMQWPEWTVDLPPAGSRCQTGEPLCTVVAEGENSAAAKALVFARARQLDAQLNNLTKHPVKQ